MPALASRLRAVVDLLRLAKRSADWKRARDPAAAERARRRLADLMMQRRGPLAKIGQLLADEGDDRAVFKECCDALPALQVGRILAVLEDAWGCSVDDVVAEIDPDGRAASLGQVHRARLLDGRQVAIKVQYPGIREQVDAVCAGLELLPGMGPVRKWGVDLDGHRRELRAIFDAELDYRHEMRQQQVYAGQADDQAVVPQVMEEWCRPVVLVQDWEPGLTVDEAAERPASERRLLGEALLRHYLKALFVHGHVHADLHEGNLAFRDGRVVIYDHGSHCRVDQSVRMAWLRLIQGLRQRDDCDPLACFVAAGFDADKLQHIRGCLPKLAEIIFRPFCADKPWDCAAWHPAVEIRAVLGEQRWWFRAAGPSNMLLPMRIFNGLVRLLRRLDTKISWYAVLDESCGEVLPQAMTWPVPAVAGETLPCRVLARGLRVQVSRDGKQVVDLEMPATSLRDLESFIDDDVRERICQRGFDVATLVAEAEQRGYMPGPVFDLIEPERRISISLV